MNKHINVRYHYICDPITNHIIHTEYVKINDIKADGLTNH